MNYSDVKKAAKALIDYQGSEARLNDLTNAVKSRILTAHSWERFMGTADVTYTGGSAYVDLDTNDYRDIFRVVALRVSGVDMSPPEYINPAEYNRLMAASVDDHPYIRYWTQMGTKLYVLGQPSGDKTLKVFFMRDPENVGWGEIGEEFFDLAATVLARMVTTIGTTGVDGRVFRSPQYGALVELEKDQIKSMIDLEYRQPGRNYKVAEDEIRTIRYEGYDY